MTRPTCEHMNFRSHVNIGRLTKGDGGPVTHYTADVTIFCADCEMPFRFVGLPAGYHFAEPRVSIDRLELRAPIEPAEYPVLASSTSYRLSSPLSKKENSDG